MSNAGGMSTVTRYVDMLAGNTTWNPWEPAGAYDALATVTVPSGGAASVEFAGIPTGYKHLQIRGIGRSTAAGTATNSIFMRFNGDTTASNYYAHRLLGENTGTYAQSSQAVAGIDFIGQWPLASSTASAFGAAVIDILDYASTSKNKTTRSLNGAEGNNTSVTDIALSSGVWFNSSTAINTITFLPFNGSNFAEFSQFALFGVK